jgi:hypothetical protein
MTCNFDISTCNINCPKFNLCMYFSLQKQIVELTENVNLLLTVLNSLDSYNIDNKKGTNQNEN